MSSRKIKKIITRFPNLECGFFAALLVYCLKVCRHLGITTGKLVWEFISTATGVDNPDANPEIIYFNVGEGEYDQHGKERNRSLCEICSLDLIRETYNFLSGRPWIREIFQLVRDNDVDGLAISSHPFNLRELMTALSYNYQDKPQLVLDWLTLAFCGVFECCKAGVPIKDVFTPEHMVQGVACFAPLQLEWFEELLTEATITVKRHRAWANKAVKIAIDKGKFATINVPDIGDVKVLEVWCDSFKTGSAGRQAGYHIVIQWNKDGHCQIHGGHIKEKLENGSIIKRWIHLGMVAKELRLLEAKFRGRKITPDQDWTKSGNIFFVENKTKIPWYLPEFVTSLYNGTMSSRDIPATVIGKPKLFEAVIQSLPKCKLVVQIDKNKKQILEVITA
ncbi:hypothetical protein GW933_03170 [Candidatus Falkowbacteria bacterium]|uniref:Uncharacterized protein n=1 Tax=Candidatus Buchananbacteria bacterium CG10_big_fil_rev_8_21_14_0_10_33_19 TaxID=1974525 RepID=A0A2H0W4T0_9BACT|nr:hypothetical protein [Candidatus Falkowbacteria bacterium]PIS06304.1 MAG: hypothetical protein COT80_01915 [Candidatus Buchananbacteria bacterium CG10_big_fil_rev_8_21_14_0_10_33_19]